MEQLISPREAAELIGVSLTTVKSWIRRAHDPLPSIAVGSTGKHLRVVAGSIPSWLQAEAARKTVVKK